MRGKTTVALRLTRQHIPVHPAVGQLCGNCYIMQQDRNLKEDLTKGDAARLSVRPRVLMPLLIRSNLCSLMTAIQVRRAILWLNLETNNPLSFEKFGHMTSLRLWEIGRVRQAELASCLIRQQLTNGVVPADVGGRLPDQAVRRKVC
jgi:hypothetical protein